MRSTNAIVSGLSLLVLFVGCSAAKPVPVVDPAGPAVRVRTYPIEMQGESELIDPGALSILSGRICGTFTEVGGERMNCLTTEDLDRLITAVAWRETLGSGCDEGQGVGCADSVSNIQFDVAVRGTLASVDEDLVLDLTVLRISPPRAHRLQADPGEQARRTLRGGRDRLPGVRLDHPGCQVGAKMTRVRLGVNVDHVATLRQARGARYPDPVAAALLAESAGADQITVHLREDRRHIQERDLRILRETVQTRLNLECAAVGEIVALACEVRPDEVTLVPERREELTTEGGLDVLGGGESLALAVARLREAGLMVSLFIDPDPTQIEASAALGVEAIELHTGAYCEAVDAGRREIELERLEVGARLGASRGLMVAAGHGLTVQNVEPIVEIEEIEELNIGHSIVARALFIGFEDAVAEMRDLLQR